MDWQREIVIWEIKRDQLQADGDHDAAAAVDDHLARLRECAGIATPKPALNVRDHIAAWRRKYAELMTLADGFRRQGATALQTKYEADARTVQDHIKRLLTLPRAAAPGSCE